MIVLQIGLLILIQVIQATSNLDGTNLQLGAENPQTIHLQFIEPIQQLSQDPLLQLEDEYNSKLKHSSIGQLPTDALKPSNKSTVQNSAAGPPLNQTQTSQADHSKNQSSNVNQTGSKSNNGTSGGAKQKIDNKRPTFQQLMRSRRLKQANSNSLKDNWEHNPELEYDQWDPEPDKSTWDGQTIKFPTATDYPKRFRAHDYSWWQPTYERKLEPYQEHFLKYGYRGEGFKAGSYYTKYISPNPKFYTKDKFYGTQIYTPFWNHMRNKYQQVDCGIDCEYLGPKDYLGSMFIYIVLFCAFIIVASLAMCGKQKYDQETQIERARELGQNILHL